MDWAPYMSGLFALGGTILGFFGGFIVQVFIQRNENKREINRLAYTAAVEEWKALHARASGIVPFAVIIKRHLMTAALVGRIALRGKDDFFKQIELLEREVEFLWAGLVPADAQRNKRAPHADSEPSQGENA